MVDLATAAHQILATTGSGAEADEGRVGEEVVTEATEATIDAAEIAVDKVQDLTTGFLGTIPSLVIGVIVLAAFWLVARLVRRLMRPRLAMLRGDSLAGVLTGITTGFVRLLGFLVFLAVVFPSVDVGTVLGASGAVALAAGFAFRDIFENLMAGLLLLWREPFAEGDVVEVEGVQGVVEAVTVRETVIRRYDRQVIQMPNSKVYKSAIRVQTVDPAIMTTLVIGISYGDDLQVAEDVAVAALHGVPGVLDDPAPDADYAEFGNSSIKLELRFYHGSRQREFLAARGEAVKAVKRAFDEHGIVIPFPITTLDATGEVAEAARAVAGRTPAPAPTPDAEHAA